MANEFVDLFIQLFLSTGVWGYTGVSLIVIASLLFSHTVKYSWVFCVLLQALTAFEYFTLGTSYFWHIIILVFGACVSILIGVKND